MQHLPDRATKRRVLIFSLAYYPYVGGAEIAIKEITDRINDVEFHMVTIRFSRTEAREERIGNILVHRIGTGSSYFQKILFIPRAALRATHLHRENRFDAFWAMMSYMLFPIVLLQFVGVRTPYLLTLQEGDPWEHMFSRWFILPFRWMLSIGFKNASAVQAISTYLAEWTKHMGYMGNVDIIPNGYDLQWFSTDFGPKNRSVFWRNQHQIEIKPQNKILISTSRVVKKNALDDIICALKSLPSEIIFINIGTGGETEIQQLNQLANDTGTGSRVYLRAPVKNTAVAYRLYASDIFIRPSRSEGLGNSFLEAMAAGKPVIGTQEGGLRDFLFDGETGWVVEKDSPEQIVKAVQDIFAHPEKVEWVTKNAQKLVSEKYEWNLIAKKMHKVFDHLYSTARRSVA